MREETEMDKPLYHEGNRQLQDRFDSRRIADRLEQVTLHDWFTDDDRDLVSRCAMFFLATADAHGQPDVSYKGGMPGFVRILDDRTLAFPDYDGNGMFRSLGNILADPGVGLLYSERRVARHPSGVTVAPSCSSTPSQS
jgi:predicted pyridoxine 5'-phosphate oxidase superfamily flavin-nucleotide-binding protein